MALYNELLSGRFNEGLVKLFGMKQSSPAPQLAGEVSPSMDLLNIPAEYAYLFNVFLWSGQGVGAAAAAQYSGVAVNNPAGSNVLCVVDRTYWFAGAAANVAVTLAPSPTAWTLASVYPREGRLVSGLYPVATAVTVTQTNNATAPATLGMWFYNPGSATIAVESPFVVMPGQSLQVVGRTVNVSIGASFEFHTRALLPSEL